MDARRRHLLILRRTTFGGCVLSIASTRTARWKTSTPHHRHNNGSAQSVEKQTHGAIIRLENVLVGRSSGGKTFFNRIIYHSVSLLVPPISTGNTGLGHPDDPSPVWSQQVKLADDRPNIHKLLLPSRLVSQKDSGKAV